MKGKSPVCAFKKRRYSNVVAALRAAFILLLAGCSKEVIEQASVSEPALTRQYRRGSLTVIVSTDQTTITTAGSLRFQLDVHAPPGDEVLIPDIEPGIEPFAVASSYSEPVQVLPNGKQLYRHVWMLVPSLPGETVFQPIEITAGSATVHTEPVPVRVTSLLPEGLEILEIKDIAGPVELLPEEEKRRHWIFNITAGVIGFVLVLLARRYRKRKKQVTLLPPHETALQALENLPGKELARIHELIRILRTYMEARFDLPMIGKTTQQMADERLYPSALSREFIAFMETCEQVRFSHKVPAGFASEVEQTVRHYIESTREVPECT